MRTTCIRTLLYLLLCFSNITHSFSQEVSSVGLIDRVLERSELIQSGIFRTARWIPSDANPVISMNSDLDTCEMGYVLEAKNVLLIFRGTELAFSWDQEGYDNPHFIVRCDHEGRLSEIGRQDGELGQSYRITPKTESISDFFSSSYKFLGAGRIPTQSLRNYIRNNKSDARDLGIVTLANGDMVRHVQFSIPKRFFAVLREHATGGTDIWDFDHMLLNIYVMPEKGYVVRRVDECLPDGTIKIRYDSTDFVDRGNGIFFPTVFKSITVWSNNPRARASKWEISEATKLNEEIPDRYFDRQLLAGTSIRDWRPSALDEQGNPRFFKTTRDGLASEADALYEEWKKSQEEQPDAEVLDSKITENVPENPVANPVQRSLTVFHGCLVAFCVFSLFAVLYKRFVWKGKKD